MKKVQSDVMAEILPWIEKNIHLPLIIDDVAHRSGYSRFYIQRLFYEYTGVTLGRHIRQLRLDKAAEALEKTDVPITEIAGLLGYESQQAFTRVFTRHFNISPGKWRRQIKSLGKAAHRK